MVERWMKERATKSLGGPCMSKFVQENEMKRLARLKNIKSSISKSSSNKHDHWTKNHFDKRHQEIQRNKRGTATAAATTATTAASFDHHRHNESDTHGGVVVGRNHEEDKDMNQGISNCPDFDLRFQPDVDVTKSGLRMKLKNQSSKSKDVTNSSSSSKCNNKQRSQNYIKIANNTKKKKKNHTKSVVTTENNTDDSRIMARSTNSEEKENQSPKQPHHDKVTKKKPEYSTTSKSLMTKKSTSSKQTKNNKEMLRNDIGAMIKATNKNKVDAAKQHLKSRKKSSLPYEEQHGANSSSTCSINKKKKHTILTGKCLAQKKGIRSIHKLRPRPPPPHHHHHHSKVKKQEEKKTTTAEGNRGNSKSDNTIKVRLVSNNWKQQQLHANRGVSLESLSKEKEEALAMLKEIDTRSTNKLLSENDGDGAGAGAGVGETSSTPIKNSMKFNDCRSSACKEEEDSIKKIVPMLEHSHLDGDQILLLNDNDHFSTKSMDVNNDAGLLDQLNEDVNDSKSSFTCTTISDKNDESVLSKQLLSTEEGIVVDSKDAVLDKSSSQTTCSSEVVLSSFDSQSMRDDLELSAQLLYSESQVSMISNSRSSTASYSDSFDSECVQSDNGLVVHETSNLELARENNIDLQTKDVSRDDTTQNDELPTEAVVLSSDSVDWTPQFKVESFFSQS